MQKYTDFINRNHSEQSPYRMDDETVIFISRAPMKGVNRGNAIQADQDAALLAFFLKKPVLRHAMQEKPDLPL